MRGNLQLLMKLLILVVKIGILHLPVYTLCNSWLYKVMKTGFFRCTNEHKPSVHCTMKVYIHAISQSR